MKTEVQAVEFNTRLEKAYRRILLVNKTCFQEKVKLSAKNVMRINMLIQQLETLLPLMSWFLELEKNIPVEELPKNHVFMDTYIEHAELFISRAMEQLKILDVEQINGTES